MGEVINDGPCGFGDAVAGDESDGIDSGDGIGGDGPFDGYGLILADVSAGFDAEGSGGGPERDGALELFTDNSESGWLSGSEGGAIEPVDDGILSRCDLKGDCDREADELAEGGSEHGPSQRKRKAGNSHLGGFSEEYMAGRARR